MQDGKLSFQKRSLLIGLMFLVATCTFGQAKILFSYDTAGNQIKRYTECSSCTDDGAQGNDNTVAPPVVIPPVVSQTKPEILKPVLKAYPNPVTTSFQLSWSGESKVSVVTISVFSPDRRNLYKFKIVSGQQSVQVDLSNQPPGIYLVFVGFDDHSAESLKIIKN